MNAPTWDEIQALARARHPERYAPDGTPLVEYPDWCTHTSSEKQHGRCGDAWQHRLASWERAHAGEPEIPDEDEERCAECRTAYGDDWICHTWLTRPCRPHDHTDAGHYHDHDGTRVERPRVGELAQWESEA